MHTCLYNVAHPDKMHFPKSNVAGKGGGMQNVGTGDEGGSDTDNGEQNEKW